MKMFGMLQSKKPVTLLLALFLFSLFAQGCAVTRKNEARLNQRLKEYWEARLDRDFEKAYEYEGREIRKRAPFDNYFSKFFSSKSLTKSYEIVSVDFDEASDAYKVRVKKVLSVKSVPMLANMPIVDKRDEVWKFESSAWYKTSDWYRVKVEEKHGRALPAK